ncbi:glutathione-dependent formaldehyde-activating, GFA [Xylaria bambusicola]|uniref:glutathione-dependent formaldehyde-activating, GFA n=1 Tax=Xylaria bambusicola TaxID=326684 RepID=UPI002008A014|nr:glutathione-dependent formaldehyde-activating, GFA [Xylaria bambusicola]KAI0508994.1 glutathione-dependent formaldehyde-activating, GFA [Xylaria bambusicola]
MSVNPSTSIQTYHANCHCGMITFSVRLPDLASSKVVSCNCSICTKNGYLFVYPKCEDVIFHSGELKMTSYRFGHAKKEHKFCPTCGTSILIDFSQADREIERQVTAINVRTFVGAGDLIKDLDLKHVDGKTKLGPAYIEPLP